MTDTFKKLKQVSSIYEQQQLEAFRLKAETFKMNQQCDDQQCREPDHHHECECDDSKCQHKYSPSPSVWAYGKARACKQAGVKGAQKNLSTVINKKQQQQQQPYLKETCYSPKFKPDGEYIYVPQQKQTHLVSQNKSDIGQTTLMLNIDKSANSLYRDHFLQTQAQNDFAQDPRMAPSRANEGLEPLQAAYIVNDGDLQFAKTQTNKIISQDKANGLVIKDIKREEVQVDPKDQYLTTFKRSHVEDTNSLRPFTSGTVFVRKIKEEEWKEIPEGVKELKIDMRTTNRMEHAIHSQHSYDISARDRAKAQASFIRDHNGENPVAGGVHRGHLTSLQYSQQILAQENEIACAKAEQKLFDDVVEAAQKLYNCTEQQARDFAEHMSLGEKKQLVFLSRESERRQYMGWDQI